MIVTDKMAEEAWALLREKAGLREDAELPYAAPSVQVAFKAAAKNTHPDKGGTAEQFAAVDRAKCILLVWLEKREKRPPVTTGAGTVCTQCGGKGFVLSQRAWRAMRVQCPTCRGTGDLDSEFEKGNGRMD